jgi:hypothetical protein
VRLLTPERPERLLWEGELALIDAIGSQRANPGPPEPPIHTNEIRDLPIVSIGAPNVWPLEDLFAGRLPPAYAAERDSRFLLARFVCSFRIRSNVSTLEFAQFVVRLIADTDGRRALAHDMHPRAVVQQRNKKVAVTLAPSLKFNDIEASIGSGGFEIEYQQLEPVISAAGIGEDVADWSYEGVGGMPIMGSKWMHMIIRAPRAMEACRAELDLSADLRVKSWLFGARLKKTELHSNLEAQLW